ncbi:hypothetical protein D3C84_1008610 [compost metagenome]
MDDPVLIDYHRAVAVRAAETPHRHVSALRCLHRVAVPVEPVQVAFLAAMQVPVLGIGSGVNQGHQPDRVVDLDQQPGTVDPDAEQVLTVLVRCAQPTFRLGHDRHPLPSFEFVHMDVSATGIKGMPR